MSELPAKIGKYQILSVAGRGAMGTVYVAHDPIVDRKVAVKVANLSKDPAGSQLRIDQHLFRNEARAAGGLVHPNIVTIYDAGEAEGLQYLVMEYLEGAQTLKDLISDMAAISVETAVNLVARCAEALDHAHAHGVVHRDIKPANIMLTAQGQPKLCDFGIATRDDTDLTQVVDLHVTPRYMAPEQAQNEPLTAQTDLFSLGVVLYELLTGSTPFTGDTLPRVVYSLLNTEPTPVSSLRPALSARFDALMAQALAKAPAKRFASGRQFAAACREALNELNQPRQLSEAEKLAALKLLEPFRDFTELELRQVLKAGAWQHFQRGQCFIEEGAASDSFYILVSGEVSVRYAGRELRVSSAGDCIGEIGYLTGERRAASAVALHPVVVLCIAEPLKRWASLPLQLRMGDVFQRALIKREAELSRRLLRLLP